ncbi:MAG: trigger factor [Vicinamibacterales bacterium]
MKADLVDVSETRKTITVEIPSDIVDAAINRAARDYSRKVRIPGFRPGKAPTRVIKQRFKEQVLHEASHELIQRAIGEALQEKGVEPVSQPEVPHVHVVEGQPLTVSASFDTLPAFDPGDLGTITITRPSGAIDEEAVNGALQRLRDRAARFETIDGRGVVDGDIVTVDLTRTDASGASDSHKDVAIEMGAAANPPGFDGHLQGLEVSAEKSFSVDFPADYPSAELAGTTVSYRVTVKALKRRILPELDDEFAKDMGEFESLDALRARVRADLEHEGMHAVQRSVRGDLMKQLATRVPFELPESLIGRELDRRLEEFAGRLIDQNIDPRQAGIDWAAFRDSQKEPAREAVGSALVLDEIAKREQLTVSEDEVEQEIGRYAERAGRTAAAVRAALEKEGGLSRVRAGLRREKSIDFAMSRATISGN